MNWTDDPLTVFVVSVAVFFASVLIAAMAIRVVPKNHIGVRLRFSRIVSTHKAGMQFIFPFIEQMVAVDMTASELTLPKGLVLRSAKGERYSISGTFSYQITQPAGAIGVQSDPVEAMSNAIRDAVDAYVNQHGLIETAKNTKELNYAVQEQVNQELAETFFVRLSKMQLQLHKEK